jgi:uncharacterized membrane protein
MTKVLTAYVFALIAFVAIDFVWLSTMASVLYKPALGDMLAPAFRPVPAVLFYLVYAAGLTYFAVRPGLDGARRNVAAAFVQGAAFGFVAYATYDLTNQATLKNWSTILTLADLAWGSFVSAAAASISRGLTNRLFS